MRGDKIINFYSRKYPYLSIYIIEEEMVRNSNEGSFFKMYKIRFFHRREWMITWATSIEKISSIIYLN
jgi:hypothetical protein